MAKGKLHLKALREDVFTRLGHRRTETVLPARAGEDCAALDLEKDLVVLSTDPITGATDDAGYLAVIVSCNDILSNGATPVGIMLSIMLTEEEDESTVARLMTSADRAAREMQVEIIGGHTEFTPGLNQNILSVTAIGRVARDKLLRSEDVRLGDELILTKGTGIEGTAILCADYPEEIQALVGRRLHEQGLKMAQELSIAPEATIARSQQVHAMHDVTEGGVLGACYEMACASGLGLIVDESSIYVSEATRALSDKLGINPYRLISSGSLLIATPDAAGLLQALNQGGIQAQSIGSFVEENIMLRTSEGLEKLLPPQGDELWTAKEILGRSKI